MRSTFAWRTAVLTTSVLGLASLGIELSSRKPVDSPHAVQAAPPLSLRELVDNTCGACHANLHLHPPGDYSLNTGAAARTPGVTAQLLGVNPYDMTGADPLTSLVVRKPLEGSSTPHGGIKISSTHPTMVALMDWVANGAPAADLNRPAPTAVAYVNAGAGDHAIVYSLRTLRSRGFNNLRSSAAGGNIYRAQFDNPNLNVVTTNLTNLPGTDDAMNPSVSLDGSKIVFARKQPGQDWQIWEVNSDGSGGLRQITTGPGNKVQPFYLPYLPDGTPARAGEGGIGFLSDAAGFRDEYDVANTLSLYVSDANGSNVRQIEFNPSHALHPWLHSSGMLIFTRWEHNEHQGDNDMSLFQLSASDYETAGTGLFGAFGEHPTTDGNSYHEASEILDANYGQVANSNLLTPVGGNGLFNPNFGKMIVRRSDRDDDGGSIAGPFLPRLQQTAGGGQIDAPIIKVGDMVESGNDEEADEVVNLASVTYRNPRSLLNGRFVVSAATLESMTPQLNFDGTTSFVLVYSSWSIRTFELDGGGQMTNEMTLLSVPGFNVDEAVALVQKPQPPQIAKPVDFDQTTGIFHSGNVTDRNPNDGQPTGFSVSNLSAVRFVRALQLSQGRIDTGRDRDDGISTQIVGEAPIASDGSFAAAVPANVPLQFQLLDTNGRVLVNHKPWVHVAPGAVERCVGCHSRHDKPAEFQTLQARQIPAAQIDTTLVTQYNFNRDIQPIFNAKCVGCHDSARVNGAAGRDRGLSLVGRETPARTTESFEFLVGADYVETQSSRESPLMWWITGLKLDDTPPTAFPNPAASVPHDEILTQAEIDKIAKWIDTGTNFRVVADDQVGASLSSLNATVFTSQVWPILNTNCYSCHSQGGAGVNAMNLDGDMNAENQDELDEDRMEQVAFRSNFMVPSASTILRKPQPISEGGLTHMGGQFWNKESDDYRTIYAWIANANPAISAAPGVTDLVSPNTFPNPFRDNTTIVYGLTGAVATKVDIEIYSQNGKLIRELVGTTNQGATIGWNSVVWDGRDKNGKVVGNDVYFYVIKAEYGDGTKKKFRGKCVKVS